MTFFCKFTLLVLLPFIGIVYVYIGRYESIGLLSVYGLLSIGRVVFQSVASHIVRNKHYTLKRKAKAAVIMTVYNENPREFNRALTSLKRQSIPLDIIVVDDGSDNAEVIQTLSADVTYVYQDHSGKREALYNGFNRVKPYTQFILTADSDTVWDYNAAYNLLAALQSNPSIGGVTGYIGVANRTDSWLTQLLALRYWIAFNHERAAQSLFGTVTCISGPLGAYRRPLIDQVKDRFLAQTFLGKPCTFGDDRHLTNLILSLGYKVAFSQATAETVVPQTITSFITQQTRWGKSHWREMLWQIPALSKQHIYLSYDWLLTLLLPFLLIASIVHYGYLATSAPIHLLTLVGTITVMSTIRIIDPIRVTKDWRFIYFIGYSFVHLFLLLPVKIYSLLTVGYTSWGSRSKAETVSMQQKQVRSAA